MTQKCIIRYRELCAKLENFFGWRMFRLSDAFMVFYWRGQSTGPQTIPQMDTLQCSINVCIIKISENCLSYFAFLLLLPFERMCLSAIHTQVQIKSRQPKRKRNGNCKTIQKTLRSDWMRNEHTKHRTQLSHLIPIGNVSSFICSQPCVFASSSVSSDSQFVWKQNCKRSHETIPSYSIFSWSDIKRLLHLLDGLVWSGLASKLHVVTWYT